MNFCLVKIPEFCGQGVLSIVSSDFAKVQRSSSKEFRGRLRSCEDRRKLQVNQQANVPICICVDHLFENYAYHL